MPMARVAIQSEDFDLTQEVATLRARDAGVGAVATLDNLVCAG